MNGPHETWDRRGDEPPGNYHWFLRYRAMGPARSLRKLAATVSAPSFGQLHRWSAAFDWADRVAAWDEFIDRELRLEQGEEIKAMHRRHAQVGQVLLAKAMERIRTVNPAQLSVNDAVRMIDAAVKIERLSRGAPSEILEGVERPGRAVPDILEILRRQPRLIELADAVEEEMAAVYRLRDDD